ncbi:hypothetical protein HOY82DRAFT_542983 [Tuber indicum]|nr:hypothetical protein HOY82DRAFT_542983 [Tuber indicum]
MKNTGTCTDYYPLEIKGRETTRDERVRIVALRDDTKPPMWWKVIPRAMYKKTKLRGAPENARQSGRPPIFDDKEKERLLSFITQDRWTRRMSWDMMHKEMGYACSADHIRRVMASMGYHKRQPQRKFKSVSAIIRRVRSGRDGIMVWGAFCGRKKSDLIFVPNKVTIDSTTYTQEVLDQQLIPFWHAACEEYGWTKVVED